MLFKAFEVAELSQILLPSLPVSDRSDSKMPLGDDSNAWKKKTSDIKENYDFKEVLGT